MTIEMFEERSATDCMFRDVDRDLTVETTLKHVFEFMSTRWLLADGERSCNPRAGRPKQRKPGNF